VLNRSLFGAIASPSGSLIEPPDVSVVPAALLERVAAPVIRVRLLTTLFAT
jgi:hypothetical protein